MANTAPTSYREIVRKIDAMIEGTATDGVKKYQIASRTLEKYSAAELLQLRDYYAKKAAAQEAPQNRIGGPGIAAAI